MNLIEDEKQRSGSLNKLRKASMSILNEKSDTVTDQLEETVLEQPCDDNSPTQNEDDSCLNVEKDPYNMPYDFIAPELNFDEKL